MKTLHTENSIHIGTKADPTLIAQYAKKLDKPQGGVSWLNAINDYFISLSKIKISEKVSFFRLLATMINAGISIVKALKILKEQTENKRMKKIIAEIIKAIESGKKPFWSLGHVP